MTQESSGGSTLLQATYGYDGLRVYKYGSVNNQYDYGSRYFLYDEEGNPVVELATTGMVFAYYTYGANGLSSRWQYGGYGDYFYEFDPQGSAVAQIQGHGAGVDWSLMFDAYGSGASSITTRGDPASSFGAQWGYHPDSSTGLELLGHRYYDPATGRFINRDPIGYDGGENLYGYANDNPVNYIDPSGFIPSPQCVALLGDISRIYALLMAEIAKYDPVKDGRGGWPKFGGGVTQPGGHYGEIQDLQRGLQNRLNDYRQKCKNDPPPPGNINRAPWIPVPKPVFPRPAPPRRLPRPVAPIIVTPAPGLSPVFTAPGGIKVEFPLEFCPI